MRLLASSAALVLGTGLALSWDVPLVSLGLFLVASTALLVLFRLRRWSLTLPIAITIMLLGMVRVEAAGQPRQDLQPWLGEKGVIVEGVVIEDPETRGSSLRFRLAARRISAEGHGRDVQGDVLVTTRPGQELVRDRQAPYLRYGDRLELRGVLELAPEFQDFDYREYLARHGIQALMLYPQVSLVGEGQGSWLLSVVYALRNSLARSLATSLPEPQASLAQTLLLGLRGGIPSDVALAFRDTGTSHLLAISGLHVGVVLGLALPLSALLLGKRRNLYLLFPLGILWLYALLAAFSPSVERAVVMATLYLIAVALGRQRNALPALGFAAAMMVVVEPDVLYDPSFQLSFAAVAGILLLWRPLEELVTPLVGRFFPPESWRETVVRWVVTGAAVSLAAVVATLPLLAFNFHRVTLLSVPATLVALPALPAVLVSSLATAVVGLWAPALGQVLGWLAWLPLSYLVGVVQLFARLPGTVILLESVSGLLVVVYYLGAALVGLLLWRGRGQLAGLAGWSRWRKEAARPSKAVGLAVVRAGALLPLATAAVLAWAAAAHLPDGRLYVTFLDVGQGDAVFVQTPKGRQVVVDGGPDPRRLLEALGKRMPFWDRTLDLVVLSHAHQDHLAGLLEVLRRYRVAAILDNPYHYDSPTYAQWSALVSAEGAQTLQATEGQSIALGDGVVLHVLNPPEPLIGGTSSDVDNNSTVLLLRHGMVSILLVGDLRWEGEASLIDRRAALESAVLKAAHHGSSTSSSREFLDAVRPRIVVMSVGEENPYGHPNPAVMTRLAEVAGGPDRILATRDHGSITLVSNGKVVQVKAQR